MFLSSPVGLVIGLICSGLAGYVWVGQLSILNKSASLGTSELLVSNISIKSFNVSNCPGYTLDSLQETDFGLTAKLSLAGPPCNAFGTDIANLTIEVTYETQTRLHVNIFDTDYHQFRVPESVVSRPSVSSHLHQSSSDLAFNFNSGPFEFWITRRLDPDGTPLFDTRKASLPPTPIVPVIHSDNSTALDGFPLVFEDQYLQLTSALPLDTNIYGLGEALASSGFRRDVGANGGAGTIQPIWARGGEKDAIDENMYGSHPIYMEHRFDKIAKKSQTHGVFAMSSSAMDILLLTPPGSNTSLIQYRMIGGVMDLYFYSGPSPVDVVEQHGALVGLPLWQPYWGFGLHLCRWGYNSINDTREQVQQMRAANIPLEAIWNDIELYDAYRDFTTDPVSFPTDEVRDFIRELASNNQHYVPIVDHAIAKRANATDIYDPYTRGVELNVFMTNTDGSEYVGKVWPGYTVFPDWFARNTQSWWTEALRNWSSSGVEFSGIWLDMNEASTFCEGSCGSGIYFDTTNETFPLFRELEVEVLGYQEEYGYNATSDQIGYFANHTVTNDVRETNAPVSRGLGAANLVGIDINSPPYAIHNGFGRLSVHTLAPNATHAPGYAELDVHNLWGLMQERTTYNALLDVIPGKRPFVISRSTFPSSGKWTGHWLGDNFSRWKYMHYSIQGILQFQLFQIPMIGADACGFYGNTTEELCNRWMQLTAFNPFYRNHNANGTLSQEPYRWESVASASRKAISIRYALLPYWYTLFANSSMYGTPPVRALFWEFPNEPELFGVDRQFLVGRDILVTPVLEPNVSTVDGIFPGSKSVVWRDWYTHDVVNTTEGTNTTLDAPLGHINVHIRDGSILLLHKEPAYTVEETRQGPCELLVSLSPSEQAFGTAFVDDGISSPPGPSTSLTFRASSGKLLISRQGDFLISQRLERVTVLGVKKGPSEVILQGRNVTVWQFLHEQEKLIVSDVSIDLNARGMQTWGGREEKIEPRILAIA